MAFITKGTVGRAGRLRRGQPTVVFAPQVAYWRVLDRGVLDPGYLFYLIRSREFQAALDGVKTHGAMAADYVSISLQHDFAFRFPDIVTQRWVASVLGALDDKIELNRRMNRTLESIVRAVFKSWFIDFDPVRKKMEGGQVGLPSDLAALFSDGLCETSLGEIPEGWAVSCLGDVATQARDSVKPEDVSPGTPYFGMEHLPKRSIALHEWGSAGDVSSSKSRFVVGDILFGKLRPYFHKVGLPPLDGICSTDIVVVRSRSPELSAFVLGHVSSAEFVDYARARSSGTRMPRTNWQDMAAYSLALPPRALCQAYDDLAKPMINLIHDRIMESRTLANLRDALLPALLAGQKNGDELKPSHWGNTMGADAHVW